MEWASLKDKSAAAGLSSGNAWSTDLPREGLSLSLFTFNAAVVFSQAEIHLPAVHSRHLSVYSEIGLTELNGEQSLVLFVHRTVA